MAEVKSAGMFSSVMDIFRPKTAEPPKVADGDPNKNPAIPNKDTLQNIDGTGPKAIPAAGEGDKSPLENYGKLWEHADTDGKPLSLVPPMTADPAELLKAAKTVDFTKAMNPEVLDKASKGDPAALGQLVNEAAQAGYAQSALATTKIVEAALTKQAEMFKTTVMPEILRRNNISNEMRADNPLFDNPAVAPILKGIETQLAVKYPTASPAEIAKHAKIFLGGMSEELIKASGRQIVDGTPAGGNKGTEGADFDWEAHFMGKKQGG